MKQSGSNFAHAMAAQLPWHVQNCGLIGLFVFMLEKHIFFRFILWAYKPLKKTVSDPDTEGDQGAMSLMTFPTQLKLNVDLLFQ